jgi:hypothetical protein
MDSPIDQITSAKLRSVRRKYQTPVLNDSTTVPHDIASPGQ